MYREPLTLLGATCLVLARDLDTNGDLEGRARRMHFFPSAGANRAFAVLLPSGTMGQLIIILGEILRRGEGVK